MSHLFLSHFLDRTTPFYGGEGEFAATPLRSMEQGDPCNAAHWSFPNHAGTHVDLPRHFCLEGKTLDQYGAQSWLFEEVALADLGELPPGAVLAPEALEKVELSPSAELLLVRTGFERYRGASAYWAENPVFRPELADYLRGRFPRLRALGFDAISVSSWTDRITGREAHRAFLADRRPVLLIEDMKLSHLQGVPARVMVAPVLVRGADAAPCTVIAEVA